MKRETMTVLSFDFEHGELPFGDWDALLEKASKVEEINVEVDEDNAD